MASSPVQGNPPWWSLEKLPSGEMQLTVGRAGYVMYRWTSGCFGLFAIGLVLAAVAWSDKPWGAFEVVGLSIGSLAIMASWLVGRGGESWILSSGRATRLLSPKARGTDYKPAYLIHEVWHDSEHRHGALYLVAENAKVQVASVIEHEEIQLEVGRTMSSVLGIELVQSTRD